MPPKVIIDGYNLLHVSPELSVRREELLENARNRLIEKLSRYKSQKNVSVAIVFDGWKGGMPTQSQEKLKGIKIIYSKLGEKADEGADMGWVLSWVPLPGFCPGGGRKPWGVALARVIKEIPK